MKSYSCPKDGKRQCWVAFGSRACRMKNTENSSAKGAALAHQDEPE